MSDGTLRQIEQSLDADRDRVAQALAVLRERLAPQALVAQGKDRLRAEAAPIVSMLDRRLRARPVAAAVAGVALAMVAYGTRAGQRGAEDSSPLAGTRYEALTRWEDEGGPPAEEPLDPDDEWLNEALGLKSKAAALLSRLDASARRGRTPAAEIASHRAAVIAALSRDTTRALGRGLDAVTGAAREQALAVRERIYLNRLALSDRMRGAVDDHPLATGLAFAAAGVLAALLVPRSATEDRLFGETRDGLVDDVKAAVKTQAIHASALAKVVAAAAKHDLSALRTMTQPVDGNDHDGGRGWRH